MNVFHASLSHAIRGFVLALKSEPSFRLQSAAAAVILVAVALLPLQTVERAILLMAVGAILVLELLNSTVERMMDLFKPRLHPYVRDIKDLMAAAVLLASCFALAVGILILWPYMPVFVRL